ncbi:MAG: molybdenum cofactor guanylyltransferase MobA [Hyphomicrobiales bacterium]|nr:molybdenum cofactor guanylyltransferase MobA [Hyphomicrobiales bacterium]
MSESTVAVLLAGGLARRMGGGDKPLRKIGEKTLLAHVIERLRPQCDALMLNANGERERFSAFGLPVVADSIEGFAGPLAGVLAGLDWTAAHASASGYVVSVATDTPFLPPDLVTRLHASRAAAEARLASAASGGRTHPVIGLWPVDIREELRRALLEEGVRKIDLFTARHKLAIAEWPVLPYDPFFNTNAPDDLAKAEGIARTGLS